MKREMNKNDRRYAYTHNVIKDAMLELLQTNDFNQITVSSLSRQAQVGRATFYTHYDNLTDVLEELIEDAIKATQRSTASNSLRGMQEMVEYLSTEQGMKDLETKLLLLPVCQRVADNPKYNVLFRDPAISDFILQIIYRQERDYQVAQLMKTGISEKEADMLFVYMVSGAYAVNNKMGWKKDPEWLRVQRTILHFVCNGYESLKKL